MCVFVSQQLHKAAFYHQPSTYSLRSLFVNFELSLLRTRPVPCAPTLSLSTLKRSSLLSRFTDLILLRLIEFRRLKEPLLFSELNQPSLSASLGLLLVCPAMGVLKLSGSGISSTPTRRSVTKDIMYRVTVT